MNFNDKTPRHGYDQCIVALHIKRGGWSCLKYLDTKTETWTHLTDVPRGHSRDFSKVCCVEGNIYLVGGSGGNRRVIEYDPGTNIWRHMPSLQRAKWGPSPSVCTMDNKVFVLYGVTTCEMLDLSEDDPQWRYTDPDNNMWTLLQQKLDGEVNGAGACLIKNYYVKY